MLHQAVGCFIDVYVFLKAESGEKKKGGGDRGEGGKKDKEYEKVEDQSML